MRRSLPDILKLTRWLDVRPGEWGPALRAFAVLLFMVAGHTALEAARDAMILAEMGATALGGVYLTVALLTLPIGLWMARRGARSGGQGMLAVALLGAALAVLGLFFLPETTASAFTLYVLTGLIGAVVVPQFWGHTGRLFTVAQGRRLLGPIAAAGMIGGVLGSGAAAATLLVAPVRTVLAVAVGFFVVAMVAASGRTMRGASSSMKAAPAPSLSPLREEPFLRRIALLVVLSTATLLAVDYLFKWVVADQIPADQLGAFFARTYTILNLLSLVMQLVVGSALVKRLGVAGAVAVTPALLFLGAAGTLFTGGALLAVLLLKGTDGTLRHSVHRITSELLYLPLRQDTRERVKPFIDGTGARLAQAVTAAALLGLGAAGMLGTLGLALIAGGLALLWVIVAVTTRQPYLDALRRTLSTGSLDETGADEGLNLAGAEVLVERLASRDAAEVIAALRLLANRKRSRLIPALVLYHRDPLVLVEALGILSATPRTDWQPLAEPLLEHEGAEVRNATLRAIARQGQRELVARLARDPSPRVRGYAAVHLALRDQPDDLRGHPELAAVLADEAGESGVLAAMADLPPSPALADLLVTLAEHDDHEPEPEHEEYLARAAAAQRDVRLVPLLLGRLPHRLSRTAVRAAMVALGAPAEDAVVAALRDPGLPRQLRKHLPRTLARFGSQRAADVLVNLVDKEADGLVRYKALRGLGRLLTDHDVRVNRRRIEELALRNLVEHLRLVALRSALDVTTPSAHDACATATGRMLARLLEDKSAQALERTFRLLRIAHRREDLERVHFATRSRDARARANAAEFLETLLQRHDQQRLRELLALALDDLQERERGVRAALLLGRALPSSTSQALRELMADGDITVAALAAYFAGTLADRELDQAVTTIYAQRPTLVERARAFVQAPPAREAAHV